MKHLRTWATVLPLISTAGHGATYGVGVATASYPVLSLHILADGEAAYHLTTHYDSDYIELTADYQHIYSPSWGYGAFYRTGFYSGFGLAGAARSANTSSEEYNLRFPFGAQLIFTDLNVQTFVETAARLGPLPRTHLAGAFLAGVRAQF